MRHINMTLGMIMVLALISNVAAGQELGEVIDLPEVDRTEGGQFYDLLFRRHSVRSFSEDPMDMRELSRLLFSGQGITRANRFRTVPSGGAQYPIDIYVLVGDVEGLDAGIYKYVPQGHRLERVSNEDRRRQMGSAALGQDWLADAPVVLVICAEYRRITGRYGERGERYAIIESGCTAQNISLESEDLGLGTVLIGAFHDRSVAQLIEAPDGVEPLLIMPIGTPTEGE